MSRKHFSSLRKFCLLSTLRSRRGADRAQQPVSGLRAGIRQPDGWSTWIPASAGMTLAYSFLFNLKTAVEICRYA